MKNVRRPIKDMKDMGFEISTDWVEDVAQLHDEKGHTEVIQRMPVDTLSRFLQFRIDFINEELNELRLAESPESVVDALIDLCVVAIGTLDAFGIDSRRAWNEVHRANMSKVAGSNPSRPNEFGLPDLIKPSGWTPPSHAGNHGELTRVFDKSLSTR